MSINRFLSLTPDTLMKNPRMVLLRVDGSDLTTTSAAAGLDVGSAVATAKDDASNQVTIDFLQAFKSVPFVFWTPRTDNVEVKIGTLSATQLIYTTVDSDSNGTGVNDADVDFLIIAVDELF